MILIQDELSIDADIINELVKDFRNGKANIDINLLDKYEFEDIQFDLERECMKINNEVIEQLNNNGHENNKSIPSVNEIQASIQHDEEFKFEIKPPTGQSTILPSHIGSHSIGQPPITQPPIGQPTFGQLPFGQPPFGQPPFGHPPIGQPPIGQPFVHPSHGQIPFGLPFTGPPLAVPPPSGPPLTVPPPPGPPPYGIPHMGIPPPY